MSTTKVKSFKLGATIPTGQYANVQPEIELEGDDAEVMRAEAMGVIKAVWKEVGTAPLIINEMRGVKVTSFTGEELFYDDEEHKYTSPEGDVLLSASTFAKIGAKEFNAAAIAPKTAAKYDEKVEDILDFWSGNAYVSTSFGSAVHKALEIYHKYHGYGAKVQKEKGLEYNAVLPKNEHLRDIVLKFIELFGTEGAEVEVMVSHLAKKRAGQIDRLKILDLDKKICRVQDYKSNNEMTQEKMDEYHKQLSFYAWMLMAFGWTVQGLDIFHWEGAEWKHTELAVLDEAAV